MVGVEPADQQVLAAPDVQSRCVAFGEVARADGAVRQSEWALDTPSQPARRIQQMIIRQNIFRGCFDHFPIPRLGRRSLAPKLTGFGSIVADLLSAENRFMFGKSAGGGHFMIDRYRFAAVALIAIAALAAAPKSLLAQAAGALAPPERVEFGSLDGKTTLVGHVVNPPLEPGARVPAVVMMHGRAGAYSSAAKGVYDASTLSQRHQFWGRLWAALGYIGVLVDGFGPRGYPQGFGRFTYDSRPAELDEVSIRPL